MCLFHFSFLSFFPGCSFHSFTTTRSHSFCLTFSIHFLERAFSPLLSKTPFPVDRLNLGIAIYSPLPSPTLRSRLDISGRSGNNPLPFYLRCIGQPFYYIYFPLLRTPLRRALTPQPPPFLTWMLSIAIRPHPFASAHSFVSLLNSFSRA